MTAEYGAFGVGAVGCLISVLLMTGTAQAQGGTTSSGTVSSDTAAAPAGGTTVTATTTTTTTTTTPGGTTTPPATVAHEEGTTVPRSEAEIEEERRFTLGVDMVLGFGKSDVITQNSGMPNAYTYSTGRSQTTTESFLFAAGYELCQYAEVGFRVPLTHGELFPPDAGGSRGTVAVGNLEFEGALHFQLAEGLMLFGGLGVTAPTAQGTAIPPVSQINGSDFGQATYDRGSVNRFAAASRGWEENALFDTDRVGIIPKLELRYHGGLLELEPYVKYESLIGTKDGLENRYIGELVAGGRLGFRVANPVSLGVRAWANVPIHNDTGVETVGVVEPEIRLHFDNVEPFAGVILPFAGPLDNPYTVGARFGIAGRL